MPNSQKMPPLESPIITHKSGSRPKIKNLLHHGCLACQMLSKIVSHNPVAPTTIEWEDYRENACIQAKAYLVGTGQWYYPPKSYLPPTNP